jgi:UDP-glucose 4,6-dehydratase
MRGSPLPVYGNGSNARSFLYCEDVAEAYDVVLHRGEVGQVYNIAAAKERRVIDVARDICNVLGVDAEKAVRFVADRPFNDQRYFVDGEKLRKLGWSERTPWEEGLKKTVEWYANNPDFRGDVGGALRGHHHDWMSLPMETIVASSSADDEE